MLVPLVRAFLVWVYMGVWRYLRKTRWETPAPFVFKCNTCIQTVQTLNTLMEKDLIYEQPQIEIVSVEVEKGFATSMIEDSEGPWDN